MSNATREVLEFIFLLLWLIGFIISFAFGDTPAILYIVISLIVMCCIYFRSLKKIFLLIIKSIK